MKAGLGDYFSGEQRLLADKAAPGLDLSSSTRIGMPWRFPPLWCVGDSCCLSMSVVAVELVELSLAGCPAPSVRCKVRALLVI